jgi:hypothetical protein
MDAVRAITTPPPESYFDKAQAKIKSGDYDFTVDLNDPKNWAPDVVVYFRIIVVTKVIILGPVYGSCTPI